MTNLRSALESSDDIKYDIHLSGITEQTVRAISADQNEPQRMLDLRLKSLEMFFQKELPLR